jgi:hypothetical protein
MQGQLHQLMENFRMAIESHENAVREFLDMPNERNSERMAAAYEEAQQLRRALKAVLNRGS